MALAVDLRRCRADAHDAVEIMVLVFARHPRLEEKESHEQVAAALLRGRAQSGDVFRRHFVGEHRQRRFGQHDQPALGLRDELGVDRECLLTIFRFELEVLVDVALDQTHRNRIAIRATPLDAAQGKTRDPNGEQSCRRHGGASTRRAECFGCIRHQCRRSRDREADQEDASQRRITRERRLRLRVTCGEPRHSERKPSAQPLGQNPKRRGRSKALRCSDTGDTRCRPAGKGGKKREVGAKERRGQRGKQARHTAEHRQGEVEPGHAGPE